MVCFKENNSNNTNSYFQQMPTATLQIVAKNVSVVPVSLVIHTADAESHLDQCASRTLAHQMANALSKKMVNQFASVHLEWEVIQQQPVAMAMNAILIATVPNIMPA